MNGGDKRGYRPVDVTRQLIYNKAMELMAKKGYQGTTIRGICRAAGVPIGTFYNCYKSKAEILRDIYREVDSFFLEVVAREIKGKETLAQLQIFAEHYARLNERTGLEMMRVLFNPENEWFTSARPMQQVMAGIIRQGQSRGSISALYDAGELVDCCFDILRGVSYIWCVCGGSFDMRARMRRHVELFLEGAAPKAKKDEKETVK